MIKKNYLLPSLLILFLIFFIYGTKIKILFTPIIAALILTYIANPFVVFLSKKIPKVLAAVLFYVLTLGLCVLLIAFIMPSLLSGLQSLISYLPYFSMKISEKIPFVDFSLSGISKYLSSQAESIASFLKDTFSFLVSATFALVLSCFFLMDTSFLKSGLSSVFPESFTNKFLPVVREIDSVFKNFFRGQIMVSLLITLLTFILLLIIKVKHAFILALIYGVFCIIPTIGPFLGAIPMVSIGYLNSPLTALLALFTVILTQIIDNTFLSPKIKADCVDISPASAFMAVYLGAGFFGFAGVIFGIPILASLKIILRRLLSAIS